MAEIQWEWCEEFLVRGRPPGSGQPAGWHAVLGVIINGKPVLSDPMTPEQAEAAGFPLSTIVNGINSAALQDKDAAVTAKTTAEADRDEKVAAAEAARDQALADKATAEAALAAQQPATGTISRAEFLARFTQDELLAISAATRSNDTINVWLITAQAHDRIDLADPLTKQGLDALVTTGLLTVERETEMLSND